MQWITRVPATVSDAQVVLARADPQAMASRQEGNRCHELTAAYGGVEQRWLRIFSEHRQTQAQRSVDQQRRTPSDQEINACKKRCTTALACAAEARQALLTVEQTLQATFLSASTVHATPR
jgi:transposase